MATIDNTQDVMDSRDIIERLEELRDERALLSDELDEAIESVKFHHDGEIDPNGKETEHVEYRRCLDELNNWEKENVAELAALESFVEQLEGYGDWEHGETVIRETYFEEYAQELAEDCGMVNANATWPNNCIDWEEAARQLKFDYTEAEFEGVTYLMRA